MKWTSGHWVLAAIAVIFLFVASFAGVVVVVRNSIQSSDAFQAASKYATDSPDVTERVGNIGAVELAWTSQSSIDVQSVDGVKSGSARIGLVVVGDRDRVVADVYLSLDSDGSWMVSRFEQQDP